MFENRQDPLVQMDHKSQPVRGDWGASIMGPRNPALEAENPDLLASPYTDAGTIPNLKFSFATARNRLAKGGWAREVTMRELPVSTMMAGVDMRTHAGRHPGNALAQRGGMGLHAGRKRQDHRHRCARPQLHR